MREEVALLDLREEEPFASGHPLFAAQLSAGRIELEIFDRVPRKDCCVVLYDDGDGLVRRSTTILHRLGYSNVLALEGGLEEWRNSGYELFQDVNSYCKAFGELVEHRRHTPSLPASEVNALLQSGSNVRVMDVRRFDEYATMNIPTSTSVPGAELVLRAPLLADDPKTTIIVNCAGRTRSIIGTQSLINAGVPNPVYALRNGTIGWVLAGQHLETGQRRRASLPTEEAISTARDRSAAVAYRAGVRRISVEDMEALAARRGRTLYRFDVRDPEEYGRGHIPNFINAPGGQLVQETDHFAPVRGATILLSDDLGVRANMTASWLAQMGWEVYLLDDGFNQPLEEGARPPVVPPLPAAPSVGAAALAEMLTHGTVAVIDLALSRHYREGHIAGAAFALRVELERILDALPPIGDIVLTSPDGVLAAFAAAEFPRRALYALEGGTERWRAEGRPTTSGLETMLSEPRDRYRRPYEGTENTREAMQAYLDWEFGLVEQLRRDGTHGFVVV